MSVAARINTLIAILAILAGLLLTFFVGERDFSYQRDAIVLEASSLVGSKPHLQLTLYYQEAGRIQRTLDELLSLSPAIRRVTLFDNQGGRIDFKSKSWAAAERAPDLYLLREGLSPLDQGLVTRAGGSVPDSLTTLSTLILGEQTSSVTIPVISVINPAEEDLSRSDFAAALADPEGVTSLFVIGYVEVALSHTVIWSLTLPTIALSAGVGLLIVFVFWLIARLTTRRITAPLTELARVADDIAAGKRTETIRVRGSGEIRDIAEVLNGMITGLHEYTAKLDTDRKILNLKVDKTAQELSEQKEALSEATKKVSETRDKMRHLAYFDTLTSLPNRKLFTEQLTLLLRLAARSQQHVGLLLVDLDNFKRVNDSLGSSTGDHLLKVIGERLTESVRDSDVLHRSSDRDSSVMDLSRMAGDEFSVVLNSIEGTEAALRVAERLAEAVAQPIAVEGQELVVTCSVGIALAPDHATEVESLLRAADAAMIASKKQGRNRITVYDETMDAANRDRLRLETDLRKAVQEGQLLLHYQPQVNARTGKVFGAESLVRWDHPIQGLIPPFKWIPIAEDLGLINDVGQWVLNQACADLQRFRAAGFDLPKISVNVSALQLNENFVHAVSAALSFTGLPPECLELELTEGVMVNDQQSTLDLVNRLKDLGIRLSIDDFGTGYSSLSYLTRLPLDELKIDRSFVVGLSEGGTSEELVRAIIAMAKSLNLDIVVEGVETVAELEFFRAQAVHIIQGYIFSAPVPAEQFQKLLEPRYFAHRLAKVYTADAAGPMEAVEPK